MRDNFVRYGLFFLLWVSGLASMAQVKKPVKYDTLKLPEKSYIVISDSIYFFENDTTLILPDTVKYRRDKSQRAKAFYEDLKSRMGRRKITKALFNALVSIPSAPLEVDTLVMSKSTDPYAAYEGKIIGEISLNKLTVFGPEVNDTTKEAKSWMQRTFNNLHWKTSGNVIRNNLLLKQGQSVKAAELADAERILRELPFLRDARFELVPRMNSDTVDIVVLTQDIFPYNFEIEPRDIDAGVLDLNHRNLFGLGYELDYRMQISNNREQVFNWFTKFRIPNIRRTFAVGEVTYGNTFRERGMRAFIQRDFLSPDIMLGGGAEVSHVERMYERFVPEDTLINEFYATTANQDYWLAKAFRIGGEPTSRTRLVVAARFDQSHFLERPFEVEEKKNRFFHSYDRFIGSIGLSQRRFFRDRLVFAYGRTEDIPVGYLFELSGGWEKREFYARRYFAARGAMGKYFRDAGYFYGGLAYESFYLSDQSREQGRVDADFRFISNLLGTGGWRFRQFVTLSYTQGINRFQDEFITINNRDGVRGLNSPFFRGEHRLNINLETVAFTPLDIVGFKVAVYGFGDVGYITGGDQNIRSGKPYTGIGAGLRIRNDNLAFRAFEVRIAWFPNVPMGMESTSIDFAGSPNARFNDFNITKPGPKIFR